MFQINDYNCTCKSGWEGQHCGTEILECSSNPCMNDAECVENIGFYSCLCLVGYTGNSSVLKYFYVVMHTILFIIFIVVLLKTWEIFEMCNFYLGTNCETNINDCEPNPCQNSAECMDLIDDYNCQCGDDWMGKNCEQVKEP